MAEQRANAGAARGEGGAVEPVDQPVAVAGLAAAAAWRKAGRLSQVETHAARRAIA